MNTAPNQRKTELRAAMRARLASLDDAARRAASAAACVRLAALEVFKRAGVVMLYLPLPNEIDLTPLAIACFREGKTVCVPSVDWARRDLKPVEIRSFDDDVLHTDDRGVRNPKGGSPVVPSTIDLVIVPGLAFDASGHRLGRGVGFYDRFLARLRPETTTIGLAFDAQVVDDIPVNAHDQAVDMLVTDRRVSYAAASPRKA